MGVKFGREYTDIIADLSVALRSLDGFYRFFEMTDRDWNGLDSDEQQECLRTLSDDVFYALGSTGKVRVGHGIAVYDRENHIIKITENDQIVHVVYLV